ncbi:hypothetical protein AL755_02910 (plasmid) [Arthrobacter sp. ERGS1:01]|uniref:hypothetical protein n=1 Tax=Arthrobacter sp. ERGS1:01 TaxID=1704044 RepID=UPI0006B55FC9|nr:hypothetical protein [Arthrobacter sp. ERGS1:01]ALE04730.1 hypothetical protein AL755_02910 [Arthrobacter sp. ERGS1:01]
MDDAIELVGDEDGVALIGDPAAIDRFLASEGLGARDLGLTRLSAAIGAGAGALHAGSEIAANAGRWVELTEKSAKALKTTELMKGSEAAFSRTVLMKNGKISGILEITKAPSGLLTNPAALTSIAGLMSQAAMQQSMDEITDYLALIDEKVDDILRAQKDAVLAEMIGVGLVVDDAITTRDAVGRVSEVTWSKVQGSSQTVASTQMYALLQLDALAEKLEKKSKVSDVAKLAQETEPKAREWIAVLARCFQLYDSLAVLELDRILDASPEELESHRNGLRIARQNRLEQITLRTEQLLARMNDAAGWANTKVLLHPTTARSVVHSSNKVELALNEFHNCLGIDGGRQSVQAKTWVEAAADARDKVIETGSDGVEATRRLSNDALGLAKTTTGKVRDTGTDGVDATKRFGTEAMGRARSMSDKVSIGIAERLLRRVEGNENLEGKDREN